MLFEKHSLYAGTNDLIFEICIKKREKDIHVNLLTTDLNKENLILTPQEVDSATIESEIEKAVMTSEGVEKCESFILSILRDEKEVQISVFKNKDRFENQECYWGEIETFNVEGLEPLKKEILRYTKYKR